MSASVRTISPPMYGGNGSGPGTPNITANATSAPPALDTAISADARYRRVRVVSNTPDRPRQRNAPATGEASTVSAGRAAAPTLARRRMYSNEPAAKADPTRNGTRPHHRLPSTPNAAT